MILNLGPEAKSNTNAAIPIILRDTLVFEFIVLQYEISDKGIYKPISRT